MCWNKRTCADCGRASLQNCEACSCLEAGDGHKHDWGKGGRGKKERALTCVPSLQECAAQGRMPCHLQQLRTRATMQGSCSIRAAAERSTTRFRIL
eukprot:32224-Chlamydomonas_euryale.AAC.2